ncbi:MAG TPA: serine hydrolase domain-containing protein [Gemmatimonadaceae bacterium]|nr:serine hydrolase domain-containing protein [Gemmatimonadaceae bacterium]
MPARLSLAALSLAAMAIMARPHSANAQEESAGARLNAAVDSIASAVLTATGVPSASVAVVRGGRVVYAHAYGAARLSPRLPATAAMPYALGSISKQFTAAAVLMLQQEGKLSLNDPVSRFIPGLTRGKDVTIRELLSHTSGYQDFWPQDYVPPAMEKPTTPQRILDHWAKQPLDFTPGTRWQYSNTNFEIAALIVQKVSGMPFFQFIRTRILEPLRIQSAVDYDAKGPLSVRTVGYMRYGLGPLRPSPSTGPGWMYGAGELAMTASDLARWDISLIDESLLQPASYRAMETTVLLRDGVSTGYGLGVDVGMVSGHRAISHSGEVSGFTAENMVFPDDSAAVAVLTNQDAAPAAGAIARDVAQVLFTKQDADTQRRTARAWGIFVGLQHGTIDRSLFTPDANAYFSAQALHDFASTLGALGAPESFTQTSQAERGGMLERVYRVRFAHRTLRVWTYERPGGMLEQYQVAPVE